MGLENTCQREWRGKPLTVIKNGFRNLDPETFPGEFTAIEREIIQGSLLFPTLHLFSGASLLGSERVDFTDPAATWRGDVFEYLAQARAAFETVLIDAPYNQRFAKIYQKRGNTPPQFIIFANARKTALLFKLVRRVCPTRIIIRSWNYYVPTGYDDKGSYLIYPGGFRRATILMVVDRVMQKVI